jgi:hypothetical protein
MRARILLTALAVVTSLSAARADQTPTVLYSTSGLWQIRVDSTLNNSCYMATVYRDNSVVRFGYNNTNNSAFLSVGNEAWKSLTPGVDYTLVMQIDNDQPKTVQARAVTYSAGSTNLFIAFKDPENFMSAFGLTSQVRLSYQGREIGRFNLTGTAQAITAMNECNQAYGGPSYAAKQDPFRQTAPARQDPFRQTAPARPTDPFKTL